MSRLLKENEFDSLVGQMEKKFVETRKTHWEDLYEEEKLFDKETGSRLLTEEGFDAEMERLEREYEGK